MQRRVGALAAPVISKGEQKPSTEQILLMLFKSLGTDGELRSRVSPEGQISYPLMEELMPRAEVPALLNSLEAEGLLVGVPGNTILLCPRCHKATYDSVVRCQKCNFLALRRERLIEHSRGGHIHPESTFKEGEKMVCPTCGRSSVGEMRVLGGWFLCLNCGEKYAQLGVELQCQQDATIFTPLTAVLVTPKSYKITEKGLGLLHVSASDITDTVISLLPKSMKKERNLPVSGKSGVQHTFDIVATQGDKRLLLDIQFSKEPISEAAILSSFAKTFDIGNEGYYLIAVPGLTTEAKNLAGFYKIRVISAADQEEIREKLSKELLVT